MSSCNHDPSDLNCIVAKGGSNTACECGAAGAHLGRTRLHLGRTRFSPAGGSKLGGLGGRSLHGRLQRNIQLQYDSENCDKWIGRAGYAVQVVLSVLRVMGAGPTAVSRE